jgi:orotidine-5'-phosphate decarboxylase
MAQAVSTDSSFLEASSTSAFSQAQQRLIVALDVPSANSALALANALRDTCHWFKVGLELYVSAGPAIVEALSGQGHSVFLDLKLHDIPNTVASAVRATGSLGVRMLTIHAAGGPAMLSAAREAASSMAAPPELLAVTVLTSMDQAQVTAIGVPRSPQEQVELLAQMGMATGIHGFVCSPLEVTALRKLTGDKGVLVIPGIRPAGADLGDQQRIATPAQALRQGASYLVVGRPITQSASPAEAARAILKEMAEAISNLSTKQSLDG